MQAFAGRPTVSASRPKGRSENVRAFYPIGRKHLGHTERPTRGRSAVSLPPRWPQSLHLSRLAISTADARHPAWRAISSNLATVKRPHLLHTA
jgi:hypothetical protein